MTPVEVRPQKQVIEINGIIDLMTDYPGDGVGLEKRPDEDCCLSCLKTG